MELNSHEVSSAVTDNPSKLFAIALRQKSTGGADVESMLAGAHRQDWAIVSPYLKQLLNDGQASSNSSAMVDAARRQIQRSAMGTNESINQRQMDRANVHMTPAQRLAMDSLRSQNATLNNTANMNTARIGQYENNINALNRLIASTNAMKKGASSTLSDIAGNEANRRMQNENARAQARQARNQTIGTVAGLGIMAAAMMM